MTHKIFTLEEKKEYTAPLEVHKKITEEYKDKFVFSVQGTFEKEKFNIQAYNLSDVSLTIYGETPEKLFHFIGPTQEKIRAEKSELEKKINIKFIEL